MAQFVVLMTNGGVPVTAPVTLPTIRVRRLDTDALVVTDSNMTNVGDGLYRFSFALTATLEYAWRVDFDPLAAGQVSVPERYLYGTASGPVEDALETVVPAIEVDTQDIQTRLPAALVGGRMDSDVGNMQTDTVDANALAADAANEIRDTILTDATPFSGANIDAAVSSRSSHTAADVDTTLTAAHGAGSWTTGAGASPAVVAAAVWDEAIAAHSVAGSAGLELQNKAEPETRVVHAWVDTPGAGGSLSVEAAVERGGQQIILALATAAVVILEGGASVFSTAGLTPDVNGLWRLSIPHATFTPTQGTTLVALVTVTDPSGTFVGVQLLSIPQF